MACFPKPSEAPSLLNFSKANQSPYQAWISTSLSSAVFYSLDFYKVILYSCFRLTNHWWLIFVSDNSLVLKCLYFTLCERGLVDEEQLLLGDQVVKMSQILSRISSTHCLKKQKISFCLSALLF